MSEHDEHSSFIKTPQQLITIVVLAFVVPIAAIVLLVQLVINKPKADPGALSAQEIAKRIQPVGRVEFGAGDVVSAAPALAATAPSQTAAAPAAAVDGKAVYGALCIACHATGAAGAPKLGDKAAWAPRIKTGADAMTASVVKGKGAMPPKAGNPALTEAQIRAAIEYMVGQSK